MTCALRDSSRELRGATLTGQVERSGVAIASLSGVVSVTELRHYDVALGLTLPQLTPPHDSNRDESHNAREK